MALSKDGRDWTKGVGDYGLGWGKTGNGLSVRQGDTIYVKFCCDSVPGGTLFFAAHGREWGAWRTTGPAASSDGGGAAGKPIILKISNIGTLESEVTWLNAAEKSVRWKAFTAPGAYDLALNHNAMWTLPPLTVTERPVEQSIWSRLFGGSRAGLATPESSILSVPDTGPAIVLLTTALLSLALVRRKLS